MTLEEKFLKIKQDTFSLTFNPLLSCFDQNKLSIIDNEEVNDSFLAERKKNILNLVKDIKINFDSKLISAYDEYSEAMTYLKLKSKFDKVTKIHETKSKTPDFKIEFTSNHNDQSKDCVVFAELKSLSFSAGNINYKNTMDQASESQIAIEKQIKSGKNICFGVTSVQPFNKNNNNYDHTSIKDVIQIIIEKIDQNIKKDQFSQGNTILIIDLKQLQLPFSFIEGGVPVFQEKQYNSIVSGIQWNVSFGKAGHLIYKPIEFEGEENIEGELERDGILLKRDWIKAIVFLVYSFSEEEPKITGLNKKGLINDCVEEFLHRLCDFRNDDKNSNGWELSLLESKG